MPLRLLLVSGNRSDFGFGVETTIGQIKQHVLQNWPKEWPAEEAVDGVERMRILYQGRFLDDGVSLKSIPALVPETDHSTDAIGLSLQKEHFVTMHLLLRPSSADDAAALPAKEKPTRRSANPNGSCCGCLFM